MSQENLEQFYVLVQNSEQLQELLGATENTDSFNELAVRLGQDNGYNFTIQEVDAFVTENLQNVNAELRDEELELVAGGKGKSCPLDTQFTACFLRSGCWGSKC
ncbi:Nif11-like leader peptide family natural product precursor [Nostoc punctiforme]|uniref:Nif11 domain-containing protein n=1 Tax=Nostoc punctiforme (strain ATCC 29133 / PCC 73102) TaxID=63737 RepID=B2JAK5_NOSP7|nr:Nif11-like leader peptide family natural product precursor [Nostoc punctiforme]ACC84959.1 hypothetical protein Npun_AF077 [Nostoc punctiforme PCC 73102]